MFQRANKSCPNMGLNNTPCANPKYWCPLHEVWLSEEDVIEKGCRAKMTADMLGVRPCRSLQQRNYDEFLRNLDKE